MHRYVTPIEVYGLVPRDDPALAWLRVADQETVLRAVAYWLARFDGTDLPGWKQIERDWVAEMILEPHRSQILAGLRDDWTLVSPQSLLIAAKRALRHNGPSDEQTDHQLFLAAVAIQNDLGGPREAGEPAELRHARLTVEMIANQAFHRRPERGPRAAQAEIRWRIIPDRGDTALPFAVADAFEIVTGVPLLDFQAFGFALFAKALDQPGVTPRIGPLVESLGWTRECADAVLRLIAATPETIAAGIEREEREHGERWSFDTLRRFPVIRLSGDRLLVLSPKMILERVLGWLPFFDMTKPECPTPEVRLLAGRAETTFRLICEREVVDSLAANLVNGRTRGRLYDGPTLRRTYPGGRIADAVIAYGDAFVVIEVTSAQLARGSVVGLRHDVLEDDLSRVIDAEVKQIESTIEHLLRDPGRLTGDTSRRRRIVPVLVVAEGIPVNPLTHPAIMARIEAAGMLQGPGVEGLHVLDTEDVYAAETMAQTDRLGLLEILDLHHRAGRMRRVDLRSWLMLSGRLRQQWPNRLDEPMGIGLDRITGHLFLDPEGAD